MIEGHWHVAGDGIVGFALDDARGEALWVEALADGQCIGLAQANLPEPRGCGFYLPLPDSVLEDQAPLQVRVVNSDYCLKEEESGENEEPAEECLTGDLYVDRGLTLTGWVLDPANRQQKIHIYAEVDGQVAADTVAAAHYYRLGIADGHGFRLELPQKCADGASHVVKILDEKGRAVPGSPIRVRSLPYNSGKWLKEQKKIDKPMQELISGLLENMEERLPGAISLANFQSWKKAFSVPQPVSRQKAAIEVWGNVNLLKSQQSVDLRAGSDCILLPGNATRLHPQAVAHMLAAMREFDAAAVFADGEDESGQPLFKPCFDREAFFAQDYLGPCLIRRSVLREADLGAGNGRFAAIMAAHAAGTIIHVPLCLSVGNIPQDSREKNISAWLKQYYPGSEFVDERIHYANSRKPRISIIIPTRDHGELLNVCLNSLAQTNWPDYEIIIIDNGTVEDMALAVLARAETSENICVLRRPGLFNYAALNNEAVSLASGELVCFLNNDTEAQHPQWLSELAALLLMAGDSGGCAGARLLWPNQLVQHGGVIVGTHQLASHVGNQWLANEPGYMNRNQFAQQYSAVTAACMLTPRKLFLDVGGFDAMRFPIAFNDVDYCLRLRNMGKRIFWTPHSNLVHHESASRGKDRVASARSRAEREMRFFRTLWGHYDDPFYNPNLTLSAGTEPFLGLAFPPGLRNARVG